mmetsp:Transcript_21369/g.65209  ORF Transcript_21369/g.65209 Transcript_21369/m.65209 type:complete len:269 (+) Transcript_21369:1127-1933(+)
MLMMKPRRSARLGGCTPLPRGNASVKRRSAQCNKSFGTMFGTSRSQAIMSWKEMPQTLLAAHVRSGDTTSGPPTTSGRRSTSSGSVLAGRDQRRGREEPSDGTMRWNGPPEEEPLCRWLGRPSPSRVLRPGLLPMSSAMNSSSSEFCEWWTTQNSVRCIASGAEIERASSGFRGDPILVESVLSSDSPLLGGWRDKLSAGDGRMGNDGCFEARASGDLVFGFPASLASMISSAATSRSARIFSSAPWSAHFCSATPTCSAKVPRTRSS